MWQVSALGDLTFRLKLLDGYRGLRYIYILYICNSESFIRCTFSDWKIDVNVILHEYS